MSADEWPCAHDTAGAVAHSCYPDGSAVTLWPPVARDGYKLRQTLAVFVDGCAFGLTDRPDAARAAYDETVRRLSADQT